MMKVWVMMQTWLVLLGMLVWSSVAQADVTVIFRKSDKAVTSWTDDPNSVQTEIQNAVNSATLGGVASDYDTDTVVDAVWEQRGDQIVTVNPGGQVVFMPNPKIMDKQTNRDSARAKLKVLGLTDDEVDELF